MPRLAEKEREAIVTDWKTGRKSIAELCQEYGVSERTVYRTLENKGLDPSQVQPEATAQSGWPKGEFAGEDGRIGASPDPRRAEALPRSDDWMTQHMANGHVPLKDLAKRIERARQALRTTDEVLAACQEEVQHVLRGLA